MELNCLPRRDDSRNRPSGRRGSRGATGGEVGLAVGGGEHPAVAQARPAPLELVARVAQVLDAVVERDDARDLLANRLAVRERHALGAVRVDAPRQVEVDLPFRTAPRRGAAPESRG